MADGKSRRKKPAPDERAAVATNRKARHQYQVIERFEAGIALKGSEVKSLRAGGVSLEGSFARIRNGELFLVDVQITPYACAHGRAPDPRRPRKLLLHRREIRKLDVKLSQRGLTLVPLSIYFVHGFAKVELALCRGRTFGDKRHVLKEADIKRQLDRAKSPRKR